MYRGVCLITLDIDAKFEKLICCFKNGNNLVNLTQALESLTNLHFHWFLLCKVFSIWPKKVERSYLSWHWRVIQKFEENLTCGLENDMEYGKFSTGHLKVSRLGLWRDPLIQSRKSRSLKFTEELCVMTMKMMQSLKRNWLVVSKLTWGIWLILTRALESLKIETLMGSFNPK